MSPLIFSCTRCWCFFTRRSLAAAVPELIVASSCSKNFGVYRERVGALTLVLKNPGEVDIAFGQAQNVARGIIR